MKRRVPPWLLLVSVVVLCVAAIVVTALRRYDTHGGAQLIARLPADGAVILWVDFDSLRRAGLLQLISNTGVGQEPDYRSFVERTGFDYSQDLHSAAVSFHRTGTYLLLSGRFDWKSLKEYVSHQGGSCYNMFCRMQGSTEARKISFCPLRSDVMALAVAPDEQAAWRLTEKATLRPAPTPEDPIWALVPISALRGRENLPAGTHMFVSALSGAETLVLSLGASADSRLRMRADVTCQSTAAAGTLAGQLTSVTSRLRGLIARENQKPNPADLSGLLASGVFEQQDRHVIGQWPVEDALLESLAGGAP